MQHDVDDKSTVVENDDNFDTAVPDGTVVMSEESFEEDVVPAEGNIDGLVTEMEKSVDDDAARKQEIRRKLEDLAEEQSFESTYAVEY